MCRTKEDLLRYPSKVEGATLSLQMARLLEFPLHGEEENAPGRTVSIQAEEIRFFLLIEKLPRRVSHSEARKASVYHGGRLEHSPL